MKDANTFYKNTCQTQTNATNFYAKPQIPMNKTHLQTKYLMKSHDLQHIKMKPVFCLW